MAFAISAPRSAWRALLWKDFQQVKPALLVVTLGLMGIQALSLLIAPWLSAPGRQDYFPLEALIGIATVAPVVCILASMGMLIGQERQTGSWAWSSSLPQSWRQSLASKTLISLSACVLPLIPLSLIPLIAWIAGYPSMNDSGALPMAGMAMAGMAMVFAIYMAVYLAIGVLIFREPLTGLIVGSITCVIGPYLMLACIAFLLFLLGFTGTESRMDWLVFGLLSVTFILASIAMVWLFRWRWSYGMTASLPRFGFSALTSRTSGGLREASRGFYQWPPAGEFRMLLAHSIQSTWGWLLLTLLASPPMVVAWFNFPLNLPPLPTLLSCILVALAAFWGIATFAGDQSAHRFRFMADRGASPRKLVTAKILPAVLAIVVFPLLCLLFAIFIVISVPVSSPAPGMVLLSLLAAVTAYLVGALSALCFRSPVMALAVSLLSIASLFVLRFLVIDLGRFYLDVHPQWFLHSAAWVTPVAVGLGFVTLYWLTRRWLVQDSPRLERHYAWIVPSLALLPVLVPTAFGFLLLPNVPWQGGSHIVSLTQGSPDVWPELPELGLFDLPPGLDVPYGPQGRRDMVSMNDTIHLNHFIQTYFAQLQRAWEQPEGPEKFAAELGQLGSVSTQTRPQVDLAANYQHKRRFYDRIYATAMMGDFLVEQGRIDLAKLAWASNKQLLDTAMRLEPYTGELGAWVFSSFMMDYMLDNLDDRQRAQWGSEEEIREQFRNDLDAMREKTISGLRRLAALHRQDLHLPVWGVGSEQAGTYSWTVRAVPTLRWRQERSLAIELDNAIAIVSGRGVNDANFRVFAGILEYWNALQTAHYPAISTHNSADQSEGMQGFGGLEGIPEEE